ncbi:MAG: SIMPL domain-containing protein [Candidatus Pacebacteria bacterium]|nr:SIMPL domain-containing protein [Candidatus Paceibacterota bacterium]
MSEIVKKYLGWAGIFALILVGYSSYKYTSVYDRSISSPKSFSVTGEGKTVVIPDVAEFSFSVITEGGKDVAQLQSDNTEKVNAAIAFLKESGIEAKDIKTQGYGINPRYKNNDYRAMTSGSILPPEIVGYTVTQTVSVKVRDFSKTGDILTGVVKAGANSVSSLNFTIDDPTIAQNEARKEAIEKAEKKAKEMAEAAGFRLGDLVSISDSNYYPYYAKTMSSSAYGMGGDMVLESAPVVEAGSQEVTISVNLVYEIR